MNLDSALSMYKLPYIVETGTAGNGFITYKLKPTAAGATLARLQSRNNDLNISTGQCWEIIQDASGLYIRTKTGNSFYNWFDYNGYLNWNDSNLPFIVGFDSNGVIVLDDIDHARHILIAGTTGSGKSVFLHNLIFTFCNCPDVYLYLVDCKRVELNIYNPCALVASDVFGEVSAAKMTADFLDIIESRYKEMQNFGVNSFSEYKKLKPDEKRHILVVDELADLISDKQARKVIIPRLLRIAQVGRAAGCHLILATQRPDHTIIDGTLKGNIPTRISFNCITSTDSRVILDRIGAEKLTGNGDGLYLRNGALYLERIQAPFIDFNIIKKDMETVARTGAHSNYKSYVTP